MSELKNPDFYYYTRDTHGQGVQDQRVHIGVPELRGEVAEGLVHSAPVLPVLGRGVGVERGGRGRGEDGGGEQQQQHGGEGWRGHTGRSRGGAAYLSRAVSEHTAAAHPRPAPRTLQSLHTSGPGLSWVRACSRCRTQDQRRCRGADTTVDR